ncbi:MAG: glycosyltransferase [Campylobacterales bacterium]|nr:glycosyltransferase [Campylobacterales bacterium]MBD3795416.1 glycosyltransferase [Campylobacterota bacterium]
MDDVICLDHRFSTTKMLIQEKPILENKPTDQFDSVLFLPKSSGRKGEGGLRTKGYFKRSFENKPLISIITVVFNGEKHLEQTIQSVISQDYDNVEYIIIDGGSTDETLEIIKKYEDQIDYWVSEKDEGIYDAMNKGISLSTGDYTGFLNADDWYDQDTIESIVPHINKDKPGYIFGNTNIFKNEQQIALRKADIRRYKKHSPIGHQSLFVKTYYLRKYSFETKYRIVSDYDFIIKLIKDEIPYIQLDKALSNFRAEGISEIQSHDKERFMLQYDHFGFPQAVYGFILETDKPIISHFTKTLVKIKHWIEGRKK